MKAILNSTLLALLFLTVPTIPCAQASSNDLEAMTPDVTIKKFVKGLKGIELYFMLETIDDQTVSLQKMAELMRYRTGKVPESLSALLPKPKQGQQPYAVEYPFHIDKINRKTGYMQMSRKGAEGTITMTYWNIDKSRKLIGTAYSLCTMICEVGSLSFSLYKDGKFESYSPIESSEDVLDTKYFLQDKNNTAALKRNSAVLQFRLPEKGTDIMISLDGVFDEERSFKNNYRFGCVKLVWKKKKGSFKVKPQSVCH